jgi:carboxypeptidase C (cathepsin A)
MRLAATLFCIAALLPLTSEARIYRWVDAQGKTQYTDTPPPSDAKVIHELDKQGMVRATPVPKLTASQVLEQQLAKQKVEADKRRDRALMQSYSKPEEIDRTRDSQIEAVNARSQTSKLRLTAAQEKQKRLKNQVDLLLKRKRAVPDDVIADQKAVATEILRIMEEQKLQDEEIHQIKERAENDKKRFIELQGGK